MRAVVGISDSDSIVVLGHLVWLIIIVAQLISLLYEARKDINRHVFSTSQVKKIVNFECSVYMYICITQVPRY